MRFQLKEAKRNKVNVTYHVLDEDSICGSINVKVEEAGDLLKHWIGDGGGRSPLATSTSQPQTKNLSAQQSLAAAFLKGRTRFSPQQILRGCQG